MSLPLEWKPECVAALATAGAAETRYLCGVDCTWHGPAESAARSFGDFPCCPECGAALFPIGTEAEFWAAAAAAERGNPGYDALMRWSQGRCFPDLETLEGAYRQAMEE